MSDFKVKFASQKRSQTSPKSIIALQNMKKWTKKFIWHCIDTAQLMGEYALSLRPIKGAGFWKKKWWRFPTITIPKSVSEGCAKNLRMTFQYSDIFLYETFSFIFGLGFDFGSDSCASKG